MQIYQPILLLSNIETMLKKNNLQQSSSNFVDLQKAFHNFEHDILLVKLVLINDHVSNKVTVKYEVPQVYVRGPHLFMINMSNLTQVIKAHHFTDNRNNRNLLQFNKLVNQLCKYINIDM